MSEEQGRSFQDLIGELEDRVRRIQTQELPLDEALRLFEEGIELTRDCHERLDADRRVVELRKE